jgi:hypothetical protein
MSGEDHPEGWDETLKNMVQVVLKPHHLPETIEDNGKWLSRTGMTFEI